MIGEIHKSQHAISNYQPPKEIAEFSKNVKKDFGYGHEILNRSWVELNDRSVIEDDNRGKRTFNAFVDEQIENPAEAWKWRGTRSKARNKAIALHSQLTAGYIIPMFMAQNEDDEEDRGFSDVMRDVVEWMVDNSNYKSSFLMASMSMLMSPVVYMGAEWAKVYQTIREKTVRGYDIKEILDDTLSGFQAPVYSADQILISNAYEQNIQRQRVIIKRRYIDWTEAKAMYGDHPNWEYVQPGIKTIYNDEDGLFYDVKDEDHPFLVEEATPMYRRDDTEVCFLNGIYLGDEDLENNPIKHRTHKGAPKYNVTPFGYQRVNEHFFYYKSLMNSMYWDNMLIDAQYELAMNRAFLDTNMPVAVSGSDEVNSNVIFPSSVIAFKDKDAKVTPVLPPANLGNMFQAMQVTEQSMEESSVSDTAAGQLPEASQKATAIVAAERNAQTMLRGVGKTLAESIVQYGDLMADIAVNNLAAAEIAETQSEQGKLKYRNLVLKDKQVKGRQSSKLLKFDASLLGVKMTDEEMDYANLNLLSDTGYPDNKQHVYHINPELFARMKYLTRVEPERMFPRNEEYQQAIMSQIYAQFRADPLIEPEALVRKTLYAFFRGESDELIAKQQPVMQQAQAMLGGEQPPQTQFGQQAQNKATGNALAGVGYGVK